MGWWSVEVATLCRNRAVFSPMDCFLFSAPNPIKKFFYRCDRKFHLDDLIKLYKMHDDYAILLVSGKRTEYYLHNINCTKFLKKIDEDLPNQHKTGGQSAQRFEKNRDIAIGRYVKKVVELMVQFYVADGQFKYKGLIIAGPAETKQMIRDFDLFGQYFEKYLLKAVVIAEINDNSVYSVVQMANDVLTTDANEQNTIVKFEEKIADPSQIDLFVFGEEQVLSNFNAGRLKEIYLFDQSMHKEEIVNLRKKTKIHLIKSAVFVSKYGQMVGIKYYAQTEIDEPANDQKIVVEV